MKTGSLVETKRDFTIERNQWRLPYPKNGDVLTVSLITPHPVPEVNRLGIVLLYFEELPSLPGLCDKTVNGEFNFVELKLHQEIEQILSNNMTTPELEQGRKEWLKYESQIPKEASEGIKGFVAQYGAEETYKLIIQHGMLSKSDSKEVHESAMRQLKYLEHVQTVN